MKGVICVSTIKGGTGKSSTAAALIQAAKVNGRKVLAVDLDPQANLTLFLNGDNTQAGSYELLHGRAADIENIIQTTPQGIDLITANDNLATEKTTGGSAKRLEAALEPIRKKYDYIVIDTPPQMGELCFNALQAADGLLIPLEADNNSIKGLYQIADIAAQMKERSAKRLSIIGVIITRYRGNANINQFFADAIKEAAEKIAAPYLGEIRDGVAIREAQAMRKNLFEYAPKSKPALDYMELYQKIAKSRKK